MAQQLEQPENLAPPAQDHATAAAPPSRAFFHPLLWLFLLAPLLLHLAALLACLRREADFTFGRLDFVVLTAVLAYAVAAGVALVKRRFAFLLVTLTYAALLAGAAAQGMSLLRDPLRHRHLVRAPMRSVSTAAATMPGNTGEIRFSVDQLGVRAPELPLEQADLRLLCVGGSAVECLHVTDERSWPWQLGARLSAQLGKTVFVGNAGKSGHIALHHEYLLRNYDYADRFEWVVVMCGLNDMGALLRHNYGQRAGTLAEETLGSPPVKGPYYRRLAWLRFANRSSGAATIVQDAAGAMYAELRAKRSAMLERNTLTNLPSGLPGALAQYKRDLEKLFRVCEERHQKLLCLTQPTLYRADLAPELASLLWEYTDEGAYTPAALESLMAAYNATLMAACKEHGVECLDLAALVPKDTSVFYDDCHFNGQGCDRVAALLADYLKARLTAAH